VLAAAGCGARSEQECGSGSCASFSARATPERVRGTVPVRVALEARHAWRVSVRGPGGSSCRPTVVRRTISQPGGYYPSVDLRPADLGRPGARGGTWCPGRYTGVARRGASRLPFAFSASAPPRTRTVDVAAGEFAALRRSPNQSFVGAMTKVLRQSGVSMDDAHLLGTAGGVQVAVGPARGRLCIFAVDERSAARRRVCRTVRQATGRQTLSGRLRTRSGPLVFALLPDSHASVRVPSRPGRFSFGGSKPVRVVDGFVAVALEGGRRPFYYARDGLALPIRYS
jgi:hypothetical protein